MIVGWVRGVEMLEINGSNVGCVMSETTRIRGNHQGSTGASVAVSPC